MLNSAIKCIRTQGGFAHIFVILLLLVGIGTAVYLVGNKTNLFPKADVTNVVFVDDTGAEIFTTSSASVKVKLTAPTTVSQTLGVQTTAVQSPESVLVTVSGKIRDQKHPKKVIKFTNNKVEYCDPDGDGIANTTPIDKDGFFSFTVKKGQLFCVKLPMGIPKYLNKPDALNARVKNSQSYESQLAGIDCPKPLNKPRKQEEINPLCNSDEILTNDLSKDISYDFSIPSITTKGTDSDQDGFSDQFELAIGTNPNRVCAISSTDHAWPPDTNNDGFTNGGDVSKLIPYIEKTKPFDKRMDLNQDEVIDQKDVDFIKLYFLQECSFFQTISPIPTPSSSPSSVPVTTVSVDLAEDPNFTANLKNYSFAQNPSIVDYTFLNSNPGQKLIYARFNLSDGSVINAQPFPTKIELIASPNTKKVLLLIHNPVLENKDGKRVSQYMNWQDPDQTINGMINDLNINSHGKVNYVIAERVEMDDYPVKQDGYKYTDETFVNCLNTLYSGQSGCHQPDHVNDLAMINSVSACDKRNSGAIDELWVIGAPFFGYWESTLAGPGAYYFNSGPVSGSTCNKLLPVMGLNYERPEEVLHSYEHRIEATMTQVYGSWQENRMQNNWDKFALVKAQSPNFNFSGCGSVHYPPNGTQDYDYANSTPVNSYCDDFMNYPNLSDPNITAKPTVCSAWGCSNVGYYKWWISKLPYFDGTGPDGKLNNWWSYIADPNSVANREGAFSNLSATLNKSSATFNFDYSGFDTNYIVDVSQTPDYSFGLYYNFASGGSSPITENNTSKMSQYVCGATLYWRVLNASRGVESPRQTATVNCP